MRGRDRAVDDPEAVGDGEGGQQAVEHPRRVGRVQAVRVGADHLGQRDVPALGAQHIGVPHDAGLVAEREVLDQGWEVSAHRLAA